MRRTILVTLTVSICACSSSSTGPSGPVINVIVRDENGVPVSRTPIRAVMFATQFEATTNGGGTAEIRVSDTGDYDVRVIPRDGYVAGIEPLARTVSVGPDTRVTLDFTVHRVGRSQEPPTFVPLGG